MFTVIVPNYNHGQYLKQRLDSVLAQRNCDFELIILDDASTDNSKAIIELYRNQPRVTGVLINEVNSGSPFRQWDLAIAKARGEWIWIAESDDYAEPEFLQQAAQCLSIHPQAMLYYCDSQVICEPGSVPAERFSIRKNDLFKTSKWSQSYVADGWAEINQCLKFDCTINNVSAWVFNRKLWEEAREGIMGFRYYGDWAFVLDICSRSSVCYNHRALNNYRLHAASYLNSETSLLLSRQEYFRILQWLCRQASITGKGKLIGHFAYHYLAFGLMKDGLRRGWEIIGYYLRQDSGLAVRVIIRLVLIKFFRRKYAFPAAI